MTAKKLNEVIREKTASLIEGNPNPTMGEIRGLVAEIADGLLAETPDLAPQVTVVGYDSTARTVTAEIVGIPKSITVNLQEA